MGEPEHISNLPVGGAGPSSDVVERLMPAVYDELRRVAASMLRGRKSLTIQPTALVHEAFMKLVAQRVGLVSEQSQLRALVALAMRRILIDHVRGRRTLKRGGERRAVSVDASLIAGPGVCNAESLDEALTRLEQEHPRIARLVIYRFFGDLSVVEAAERLGVSVSTAETDWRFGRAWLKRALREAWE